MAEKGKTLNGEDHDYQRPSKITKKPTRWDDDENLPIEFFYSE